MSPSPGEESGARGAGLVVLLLGALLLSARNEGYLPLISPLFGGVIAAGSALAIWLAVRISAGRLAALIATILFIEYAKESIGIRSSLWIYQGKGGQFFFGVFAWILGGLSTHSVSTGVTIPLLRRLPASFPRSLNLALAAAILLALPTSLGPYGATAGIDFGLFYALLSAVLLFCAFAMDLPSFAGIVLAAWLVGNVSEYAGSISSGAWTFLHSPTYPPFFLVFSCWPMEIMAQHSAAAWLSGESLNVTARPEE